MMKLPKKAHGLGVEEERMLKELVEVFEAHKPKNYKKEKYYEGNIPLSEVNLGIALPSGMANLEIGCS